MTNHTDLQPGDLVSLAGDTKPAWEIVGPADNGVAGNYKYKTIGYNDGIQEPGSFSVNWPVTRKAAKQEPFTKISPEDLKAAASMAEALQNVLSANDAADWYLDLSTVALPFKNYNGYQIGTFSAEDGMIWFTPDYKED